MDSVVEDFALGGGRTAYLVRPSQPNGAGVLFLHWLDESPTANRSQFLTEAERLAHAGVVSLLPQLDFPWNSPPTGAREDLKRIQAETAALKQAYESLVGAIGVEEARVALVGHDFGAMHGMSLFGVVELVGAVLIAATPRWADWFLRFWPIAGDRFDYLRALNSVDPITAVVAADCPLLFQFGKSDFYIAAMTGLELFEAAPEPKQLLSYESGHGMEGEEIQNDRVSFLTDLLRIGS